MHCCRPLFSFPFYSVLLTFLAPPHAGLVDPARLQPTWLFLELLHALEQGIFNAYQGSVGRPAPPPGALAFFAGNRKVGGV